MGRKEREEKDEKRREERGEEKRREEAKFRGKQMNSYTQPPQDSTEC